MDAELITESAYAERDGTAYIYRLAREPHSFVGGVTARGVSVTHKDIDLSALTDDELVELLQKMSKRERK